MILYNTKNNPTFKKLDCLCVESAAEQLIKMGYDLNNINFFEVNEVQYKPKPKSSDLWNSLNETSKNIASKVLKLKKKSIRKEDIFYFELDKNPKDYYLIIQDSYGNIEEGFFVTKENLANVISNNIPSEVNPDVCLLDSLNIVCYCSKTCKKQKLECFLTLEVYLNGEKIS